MITAIPKRIIVPIFQPALELETLLAPHLAPYQVPHMTRWQFRTGFPHVGMLIVSDFIDCFLNSRMKWVENATQFHEKLREYMKPDIVTSQVHIVPAADIKHFTLPHLVGDRLEVHRDETQLIWCEEIVHMHMLPILNDLIEFIGEDSWCIYTTKRVGLDLAIEKGEDYRIREWMMLKKKGKI